MSNSKREEEGRTLMAAAERKAEARAGFFRSLFGASTGKEEDAAETFVKAANAFKLAKSWELAGDAFVRAAETFERSSDLTYDAGSKYADAAKAYKNGAPDKAIAAYRNAIRVYTDAARFQQCARLSKELAEMHEANRNNEAAMESYSAAADFYDGEDSKSHANAMRLKLASISASDGKYAKAAELFERIAADSLDNNLLKYSARDHLLKAGLCRLCLGDAVGAARAVHNYKNMDASFAPSREGQLLDAVVKTVEDGDVDAFTNAVYEYDNISKLDDWKTSILLKIKNSIKEVEDDLT
jgi:alpha-soluble NSF attachment protein